MYTNRYKILENCYYIQLWTTVWRTVSPHDSSLTDRISLQYSSLQCTTSTLAPSSSLFLARTVDITRNYATSGTILFLKRSLSTEGHVERSSVSTFYWTERARTDLNNDHIRSRSHNTADDGDDDDDAIVMFHDTYSGLVRFRFGWMR